MLRALSFLQCSNTKKWHSEFCIGCLSANPAKVRSFGMLLILTTIHVHYLNKSPFHKNVQEPITRSLQLPHIPVTTFLQTDLFLV